MAIFRYLSHPHVKIDPDVPVPQWGLSELGRQRSVNIRNAASLQNTKCIISSAETKAIETAAIIAEGLGLKYLVRSASHENDRSATGYLHGVEFENAVGQFFTHPTKNFRGWESAFDAQARIVSEALHVIASWQSNDILMVGHGGVGTLLYCHFAKMPIQRIRDQPPGGGNYWALEINNQRIIHGWQAMERLCEFG
jgi:broad specificity phosphatase PhoE